MSTKSKEIQTQDVEKQEVEVTEGTERTRPGKAYIPRADIYETEKSLVIVADMPGVNKDAVDITLEKNILTLNGTVEFTQPDNFSLAYSEYETGDFERSFTLSSEIDRDNIEAAIKDGVLKITLPKVAQSTKKIAVKAV
jgi:HSP20 family molecular chaperone IbpA